MTDEVQPGVKINRETWERFRQDVKRRKGGVRGHLKNEVENALNAYCSTGDATPVDIDERLQRIEAAVGAAPTDGGTDAVDPAEHTHTPNQITASTDEKPAPNAATDKKIAYLAERVIEEEVPKSRELHTVPKSHLQKTVKDEYGFRRDTAKRYVDRLIDHFGIEPHPEADGILVSPTRLAEIEERRREEAEKEAQDKL